MFDVFLRITIWKVTIWFTPIGLFMFCLYVAFGIFLGYSLIDETGKDISAFAVMEFVLSIPFCIVAWPIWLIKRPRAKRLYEFYKTANDAKLVKILGKNKVNFTPLQYKVLKRHFENRDGSLTSQEESLLESAKKIFDDIVLMRYCHR